MDRRLVPLLAGVLLASFVAAPAPAAWLRDGNPVATLTGAQQSPLLASDDRDGAFVVWTQGNAFGQHVTFEGVPAPGWPAEGLPVPPRAFGAHFLVGPAAIEPDGAGGIYIVSAATEPCVAHCSLLPATLVVQRLQADGTLAPGWPPAGVQAETTKVQEWLAGALQSSSGPDGVVFAYPARDGSGTWIQSISPDGTRRWGPNGIALLPFVVRVAVLTDGEGGAFAIWNRVESGRAELVGQHFSAAGVRLWGDGVRVLARRDGGPAGGPVAVRQGAHGVLVAWATGSGVVFEVIATTVREAPNGRPQAADRILGSTFPPQPGSGVPLAAATTVDKGVVVAWLGRGGPSRFALFARRIAPDGRVEWGQGAIATGVTDLRVPTRLALAGDGRTGAFLAWNDLGAAGRLRALRLAGRGDPAPGWPDSGAVLSRWPLGTPGWQQSVSDLHMVAAGSGHAFVSWSDTQVFPDGTYGWDARAWITRLDPEGPAGGPDARGAETPGRIADVARRAPPGAAAAFALEVGPNPAGAAARARFTLPDATPATLALYDLAGRRLWSREVGALGAGAHVVPLPGHAGSPPGVYLLRLAQGARVATARVAIVR